MSTRQHEAGITIVEVIIGVSITALVTIFISQTLTLFFQMSEETLTKTQALYLAEEGQEILRYLRDSDWNEIADELSNDTTYYLAVSDSGLATTTTPEIIDGTFTRSFELSAVERDGNDDIVSSGAVDNDSRFVTFTVGWGTATVTTSALLTNLYDI